MIYSMGGVKLPIHPLPFPASGYASAINQHTLNLILTLTLTVLLNSTQ